MYDHNQTLVPESFLGLYVRHGRPLLEREEMEARHESAELLAQQIAEVVTSVPPDARIEALGIVKSGLLADLPATREAEAAWIEARAVEICQWEPVDP